MLALVDRTNERITADLEEIAASKAAPEERLRQCLLHRVTTIFDLVRRYPHGEDVITSMKPEIVRRIDVYVRKQGALLERILREGCRCGVFEKVHAAETGHLLAGLFEHFTPPYYRFASKEALGRFANAVVDLMLSGLLKRSKSEKKRRPTRSTA